MKLIYTIVSLIEWIAISYFAIPESVYRASQIQCEEWISGAERNFRQIKESTFSINFSLISIPDMQALDNYSGAYKLTRR